MTDGGRRIIFVLAFISFLQLARVEAQQIPPSETPPVFRSRSQMVLVPVVVKDHQGNHVSGLASADFIVKENGIERKLAICDEVKTSDERILRAKRQRDLSTFSNVQPGQPARRIVILALDAINTPFAAQANARKQLLKYLSNSVDPNALVSLLMIKRGGVKVIHDFTTDSAVLSAALKKVRGAKADVETIDQITPEESDPALQAEVDDLTAFEQGETDAIAEQKRMAILDTLGAMQQIAQRYMGVPGRKALVWVTAGFPFSINGSDALMTGRASATAGLDDLLPEYEHAWTLFNAANIAVYPVDVRGLENPASMDASLGRTSTRGSAPRQIAEHQDSLDTFGSFAEMTGGRAFYDTNDLSKSFLEAAQDSASYYMLGYYLDRDAKPGWHTLKVSVHRSATRVRARDGFFVEENEAKTRESDLAQALTSPMDFTAVPLTLRWDARVELSNSEKTKVSFDVELPPGSFEVDSTNNNHVSLDVLAVAKLPDGKPDANTARKVDAHLKADTAAKAHEKGLTLSESLQLAKGDYTVRVVVLDNLTGKIGTVSAPIEVQ